VPTDSELLDRWAAGDTAAAEELLDRYFEGICRFFRNKVGGDVDDLIQQTFSICVQTRERLRNKSSFRAYLYTVARNEVYAHYRRLRRVRQNFDPTVSSVQDLDPSPSQVLAKDQQQRLLLTALRRIALELQIALELRYWEQLSGPELSEVLEIPEGTVRSRLRRGTQMLRDQLGAITAADEDLLQSVTNFDQWASRIRKRLLST
jgi:RNA polymerase sigma-70 factor (ECF subfamily)